MSLLQSQNRINELLARFVAQVKGFSAMGRTDLNKVAENILIPILSNTYGYINLKNLNIEEANYPGIDLAGELMKGGKIIRIAFQITATTDTKKVKKTLRKFVEYELYKKYDRLIIYILTEKQKSYSGKGYEEIIQGKFTFDNGFKANLNLEEINTRKLKNSEISKITKVANWNQRVEDAVDLYYRQVKFLAQNRNVDVIVCTIPNNLYDYIAREDKKLEEETLDSESSDDRLEANFRRALKARTMGFGKPIQLVRELSLESNKKQQDSATKAWNFCTALYFKANKTVPWKLVNNINQPSTCFVGIGFYRSRDKKILNTSLAQIFDELGNSVILRGTPVDINKDDRRPYLKSEQALYEYDIALSNSPARLIMHKSSKYNEDELDGFRKAAEEMRINSIDFVTILDTSFRLFRDGDYPPYRGTHIELDKKTHLLYTRGYVKYYQTYPGLYIPQPIEIRIIESDESPNMICREILGLTKMNWNNTQFDGKYPITIKCARNVGQIMKYLSQNEQPQISYSFYM